MKVKILKQMLEDVHDDVDVVVRDTYNAETTIEAFEISTVRDLSSEAATTTFVITVEGF